MASTVVSSNQLPLRSPYRLHGAFQCLMAAALAGIVVIALPSFLEQVGELRRQFGTTRPDPDPRLLIVVALKSLGLLFAALSIVKHGYGGLHRLLTFFVPAGIPGELRDAVNTSRLLFVQRAFLMAEQQSALIRKAMARFSPRLAYLNPPAERLLRAAMSLKPLVACGILVLIAWGRPDAFLFPWIVLVLVAVAKGVYALVAMSLVPNEPSVSVVEDRQHFDNTGNPVNFFHHLEAIAQELRYKSFPNRVYGRIEPDVTQVQPGITSKFTGGLLLETQPVPRTRSRPPGATLLALAAIAFGAGGTYWLLHGIDRLGAAADPRTYLTAAIAALVALVYAGRFLRAALELVQVFRFESHLFWIDLKGTFSSSGVGIGDGRGGQFFAERRTIQSDTHITAYGAKIVTECWGPNALRSPRSIIDCDSDEKFSEAFAQFLGGMPTYKDSTTTLPSIAFEKPGVKEILQANLSIAEGTARATAQAGLAAPPPVPRLAEPADAPAESAAPIPLAPVPEGELKTCPECGEKVRAIAKKCRFCNYRFDAAG